MISLLEAPLSVVWWKYRFVFEMKKNRFDSTLRLTPRQVRAKLVNIFTAVVRRSLDVLCECAPNVGRLFHVALLVLNR